MSIEFNTTPWAKSDYFDPLFAIYKPTLCELSCKSTNESVLALVFSYGVIFFEDNGSTTYSDLKHLRENFAFIREMPREFELTMRNK
jgi:hypothetical protein